MITKSDFTILLDSLQTKTRDNGEEFYCRKEGLPEDIDNAIKSVVFKMDENCHDLDLSYKILDTAILAIGEAEYKDLENFDASEDIAEYASCYIFTRYLNAHNQNDISDLMKEYGSDISTACAIWYNNQVREAIVNLMEFINK